MPPPRSSSAHSAMWLATDVPAFPIARYLVPVDPPALDDRFTVVDAVVTGSLPFSIDLSDTVALVLSLPTGLAVQWLDADPNDVLTTAQTETTPQPAAAVPVSPLHRAPVRLYARVGGRTTASIPLAAGMAATFYVTSVGGTNYAVQILDWDIRIGNVHGAGNFGSHVKFAWRRADAAVQQYSTPSINPHLWWRLPVIGIPRIESWVDVAVAIPKTLTESVVLRRGAYDGGRTIANAIR